MTARVATTAVGRRLEQIRTRVARACDRSRRDPASVTLVGVTKRVDVGLIREALDAGLSHLGENRVQEAIPKMRALADRAPTWHLIGHLQTNKARKAATLFDRVETVDSLRLAEALEETSEEIGRELRVFVQVAVVDEESKHGVPIEALPAFLAELDALPRLTVTGLMAIPPVRAAPEDSRPDFRLLADLFHRLREQRPALHHLSMGMSADFEIAIEEGSTEVRVGTALFGARAP